MVSQLEVFRNPPSHFDDEIFPEQLPEEIDEKQEGYDDDKLNEGDTRKSSHQISQSLLYTLTAEMICEDSTR
jgi:hypothetical protein